MCEFFEMSRSQLFVYLDDLKRLGVLVNEGRVSSRGTAVRRLNMQALAGQESGIGNTKSPGLGDQESGIDQSKGPGLAVQESGIGDQRSGIGEQESGVGPDPTDTHRHTPTHTDLEKAATCVSVLIQKFTVAENEPPRISGRKEKEQLEALARAGSENFAHAGDAWLRQHPWDSNTKFPFLSFINGFAGYATMKVLADRDAAVEEQKKKVREDTTRFWEARMPVQSITAEYILTLQPDDQEYIAKVNAAVTVSDLPDDAPARSYKINETWSEFKTRLREQQEREDREAAEEFLK